MTNKNAPCRLSGGSNGGIRDTLYKKYVNPKYRAAQCFLCRFYAEICLQSGHVRRLCRLNGEKNPTVKMAGCVFERAVQGDFGGLTAPQWNGKVIFPNYERPCSGLAPKGHKVALQSAANHVFADKCGNKTLHIGRAQRPHVREAAAASHRPGSVVALPFCFNNPELSEVSK